ncbi:hypothetical protein ACGK9R_07910 [Halomonas sp. HNIBRBA4712]|uniref:hypothetical protein n=1 Tax=Halomonas sp. HNIBRBA4712 TaxID=3373087 RepID=UPI003745A974
MPFAEAKEHVHGRLHGLFADPYRAFENSAQERELHVKVALYMLLGKPMAQGLVTLRIIHGWENGGCDPADLAHIDSPLISLEAFRAAASAFDQRSREDALSVSRQGVLLAEPLAAAIKAATARGETVEDGTRATPARWPAFEGGLALYTQFKMYHRLVYGEDERYRCSLCDTALGRREIHEFHLEEGEFALLTPPAGEAESGETLLVLHESQLEQIERLFEQSLPLMQT